MLAAGMLLAGCAIADTPTYGKVETFQPGKKYNCVPTADRKGWDCSESGQAESAPARGQAPAPTAAPSTPAPPQAVTPSTPRPAADAPPKASALPGYLMNSAAGSRPASPTAPPTPKAVPAPEPVAAAPAASQPEQKAPAPTPKAEPPPPVVSTPAESDAKEPQQSALPAPAESPSAPKARPSERTNAAPLPDDFLALPSDQYVVELARADSAGALAEPAVPAGKVYKLHLRQSGNGSWLLLWGPFDSIEKARRARDEAIAQDLTPGWPRPIGPLQAEVRRTSE